jgi:hypothetical protein
MVSSERTEAMLVAAQLALPMLLAMTTAMQAQDNPSKAAAATRAHAPAATTTPVPSAGSTETGVPKYRAGFRGKSGTAAPTATADVSVTGGKGDDGPAIDPKSSSLSIPGFQNAFGVKSGTAIHVRLKQAVDSGHAKNGDMLDGVLAAPVGTAPAGAPVKLTVVATAAAGTMTSAGELSVQVVSVGGQTLLSNVITAEGEQGMTLTADGAPARGTEASFTPDKTIELPAA